MRRHGIQSAFFVGFSAAAEPYLPFYCPGEAACKMQRARSRKFADVMDVALSAALLVSPAFAALVACQIRD